MNIAGWNDPMALRGLSGSVPSDSTFASYHKAPGSEREYAQVGHDSVFIDCLHVVTFARDITYLPQFVFSVCVKDCSKGCG